MAFKNTHRREELHWCANEHGDTVDELDGIDDWGILRVVGDDLDLGVHAKCGVAKSADRREDYGNETHDDIQQFREVLRRAHRSLNRKYEANSFEGEDCGPNGKGIMLWIEELDCWGDTICEKSQDVVVVDVSDSYQDADISQQGGSAKFGDVANEGERDKERDLDGYETWRRQWIGTLHNSV
jgi:hypothetical protein